MSLSPRQKTKVADILAAIYAAGATGIQPSDLDAQSDCSADDRKKIVAHLLETGEIIAMGNTNRRRLLLAVTISDPPAPPSPSRPLETIEEQLTDDVILPRTTPFNGRCIGFSCSTPTTPTTPTTRTAPVYAQRYMADTTPAPTLFPGTVPALFAMAQEAAAIGEPDLAAAITARIHAIIDNALSS
jgi:hypothetical protein